MSRRRYDRSKEADGFFGILILAIFLVIPYLQSNPIITSLSCALSATVIFLGSLWLRQRRAIRNLNRIVGRQMYLDYTPREFETAVAELFRAQGYTARLTPGAGDGGLDILLSKDGEKFGVECKQYKRTLGPKYIRDFIGALQLRKLKNGLFVTTSDYSQDARQAADSSEYKIHLIDGEMLGKWQCQIQKKLKTGETKHTAFLPLSLWVQSSKTEKALIIILLALLTFILTFIAVYFLGTYFGFIDGPLQL